jgi:hypothetical protein
LQPQLLARIHIKSAEVGPVIDLIKTLAIQHRRREATLPTVYAPFDLLFLDVTLCRCVNRDHHPHFV